MLSRGWYHPRRPCALAFLASIVPAGGTSPAPRPGRSFGSSIAAHDASQPAPASATSRRQDANAKGTHPGWIPGLGSAEERPVDFSASGILASLLISSIGYVLFHYGKKSTRMPQLVSGLVLMIFPTFVSGALLMLSLGAVVLLTLWVGLRAGL